MPGLRCGCPNEGDEIVFGPRHDCTKDRPEPPTPKDGDE